jgi:hypothetical protein
VLVLDCQLQEAHVELEEVFADHGESLSRRGEYCGCFLVFGGFSDDPNQ